MWQLQTEVMPCHGDEGAIHSSWAWLIN